MTTEYISAADLSADEIHAGLADGTLQAWRTGTNGHQWYRREIEAPAKLPEIRGVPTAEHTAKVSE